MKVRVMKYTNKDLVNETTINKSTGEINIKRNHPHVSDFNPFMMAGFRSNHNIQFLGTSNNECLKRIYYCTNYMTKNGISSYTAISFAASAFEKFNKENNVTSNDYAKQLLYKTYNFASYYTEYSGPQVASMILQNGKDGIYYSSHETISLNVWEILKYLKLLNSNDESDTDNDNEDLVQMPTNEKINDKEFIKIKDYIYRNNHHNDTNIYDFTGKYLKKKK